MFESPARFLFGCDPRARSLTVTVVAVALCGGGASAARAPVPISPGRVPGEAVPKSCPTFHWTAAEGADSLELEVYGGEARRLRERKGPVLAVRLPGTATGWTPAADQCLERGRSYLWSIRAIGEDGAMSWSSSAGFRVSAGKGEFRHAVIVVHRYLAQQAEEMASESARALPASDPVLADSRSRSAGTGGVVLGAGEVIVGDEVAEVVDRSVFVTSTTYDGNLGGLAAADAECNARAAAAGLAGTYKAWLADTSFGPADAGRNFVQGNRRFFRIDGVEIAFDWDDLVDSSLRVPIDLDESGQSVGVSSVWTGTNSSGNKAGQYCSDWGSAAAGSSGITGSTSATGGGWTNSGPQTCAQERRLYCFEQ